MTHRDLSRSVVMEQPPGSLDDLQPQDLSTSSITTVIDLTRKGNDCVRNATSLDALRLVRSPGWYPNSGASNPGLPFPEAGSSDLTLQSGDQIQPDNAFSHTTVTLSYVSRSCVLTTRDSLSRHSPLCGVPSISTLSLHPASDLDEGLGDADYALKQLCLEKVDAPVDLATQTELFQSSSQAQVGPENEEAVCLTGDSREVNGGVISRDEDVDELVQEEHKPSLQNSRLLENGQDGSWSSSGVCAESSPERLTAATEEDEESDVVFLMSKKCVLPDSVVARDLCSVNREYTSPLEEPVSPSVASQDDVEDVFVLPQASSSPSGDNSHLETTDVVAWNDLSTVGAIKPGSGTSDGPMRSDSSNENERPVQRGKAVLETSIDLTDDACLSEVSEHKPKTVIPHMNGNVKALQRSLKEKKLPARSGRGMRLEAIVMNINSSRYKVSGCIRTNKKANSSQSTASNKKLASAKKNDTLSAGKKTRRVRASLSVKAIKQKTVIPLKRGKSKIINNCKDSTSDSEINHTKKAHTSTLPNNPPFLDHKNSEVAEQRSQPVNVHVARCSHTPPPSKSPKKSQGKAKSRAAGGKMSPTANRKGAKSRQKKRKKSPMTSLFSPKEPEIKLRYVNYKEEKRDLPSESFSPFIHVERRQSSPSLCTVINYPEEVRTRHKKGQQAPSSGFVSAVVPSTSCLQLGRASSHGQHRRSLVCCLCGLSANAMDLGDLHGPYYPEGYQPSSKTPAGISGLKADGDFSDSESSSCSMRDRGRKIAVPTTPRPLRPGAQLKQKGLQARQRWSGDNGGSPAAKRVRSDAASGDVEDWYSPPVLPLEPCEYWLHEDCGIWSAGVFLVKGKVYGLEEAVRVAQEMTCSSCCERGATLGCFFKSCPSKYHYRCALESGCVLLEENFSIKCQKHKNKTFKAPPGNRWDDR